MKKQIIYDISLVISPETVVYPADPSVQINDILSITRGDEVNLSLITMGSHTGTHVDAPKHFYNNGLSISELPLDYFIGKAKVVEIKTGEIIEVDDLRACQFEKNDIVLLKTKNSTLLANKQFIARYVYVSVGAAQYLAEIGIKTLGFDYFSVDRYGDAEFPVHHVLLKKNIVILEGLDLSRVLPGEYQIIALPIRISDGNGSPVRAVLLKEEDV